MTFDSQQRQVLADLADVLIPAQAPMLSASQAAVHLEWLDRVLEARPDLGPPLQRLLAEAQGREPAEFIAELEQQDAATFRVLTEVVPGAYFMNPQVLTAIGYDGQSASPIDPRPDYMEDGLLQSVILRGPIFRPTV